MKQPKSSALLASQVAARLGVKLETVYAYVSRGLLTRLPGAEKESRFDAAQVEQLRVRGRRTALEKPEPLLLTSALTEVTATAVRYRGKSALELARTLSFERVVDWLWAVPDQESSPFIAEKAGVALARTVQGAMPEDALPLERLRVIGAVLGSTDALRYETSRGPVIATARALIAGMVESLPKRAERATGSLAQRLFAQLSLSRPSAPRVRALEVAMSLCADHGLSPSTLAVRVAASQRADPYSIVQTGLGALGGALHGAASLSAEELIAEIEAGAEPSQVIGTRLRRGDRIPGFGHRLHSPADPRAQLLLAVVRATYERTRAAAAAERVERVMRERGLPEPNIDWSLAVLVRAAGMQHGASEAIMAIARIAGWVAHSLEEYRTPTAFPRSALYIGPEGEGGGAVIE
jgi:citrate synthase